MAKGAFLDITNLELKHIKLTVHRSSHRRTLFRWLFEVCQDFHYSVYTHVLALTIIDAYTARHGCCTGEYQLVGISALLVAAKLEEKKVRRVAEYAVVTDGACQACEILAKEKELLDAIDYAQSLSLPQSYFDRDFFAENYTFMDYAEKEAVFSCMLATVMERHAGSSSMRYLYNKAVEETENYILGGAIEDDAHFYIEAARLHR
ncbi:hypothetical protein PAPHI01_0667 [Pancytospora philotis]|nr:hypothetical protein PAPHI01_0667 [Pancytospora philotis]